MPPTGAGSVPLNIPLAVPTRGISAAALAEVPFTARGATCAPYALRASYAAAASASGSEPAAAAGAPNGRRGGSVDATAAASAAKNVGLGVAQPDEAGFDVGSSSSDPYSS